MLSIHQVRVEAHVLRLAFVEDFAVVTVDIVFSDNNVHIHFDVQGYFVHVEDMLRNVRKCVQHINHVHMHNLPMSYSMLAEHVGFSHYVDNMYFVN